MEIYGVTGERLGDIGQRPQHPSEQEAPPKWKTDLTSKPSISTRKGIAFGFEVPFENTSTLVLTVPSGRFVDVRFANGQNPIDKDNGFWAFTGTATTSFPSEAKSGHARDDTVEIPYMLHCKWNHVVDSDEVTADEGDMFSLPNGESMEFGTMADPRDGQVKMYKEYWEAYPGPRAPYVVAERADRSGLIIRIGDHSQGVLQKDGAAATDGTRVWVERWMKIPLQADDHGVADWNKDWRSNTGPDSQADLVIPMMWACEDSRQEGDKTVVDAAKWEIIETSR